MGGEAVFERMRAYADDLERTAPPVFVGRRNLLDDLERAVARVADANPRGMTRIIQGVPGAGKSSLCDEFLASVQGKLIQGRRILCAKLHPEELGQPPLGLVGGLANALPESLAEVPGTGRFVSIRHPQFQRLASTALQVFRRPSVREMHDAAHGLTSESTLGACINTYAKRVWPKDAVLVLAFDEMQNCPVTDRAIAALGILNECLHEARILLTCFGLQNTKAVMRDDLRLSRISADAVTNLGPLNPGEGREVLERTLDFLGASAGNAAWLDELRTAGAAPESWAAWRGDLLDRLEDQAGDFPQHLTAALRSACQALCRRRDGSLALGEALRAEIEKAHEANKAAYYADRIGDGLKLHRTALGALARAAGEGGGVPRRDAVETFMAGDDEGVPMERPAARDALGLAIAQAVLGEAEVDGVLCCMPPPIPSMARHLAAHYDRMLGRGDPSARRMADRLGLALPQPSAP